MAESTSQNEAKNVGDRFPALKELEEVVERAKLEQGLAEARAAKVKAHLPDVDVDIKQDTATVGDKTGLARVLVQMDTVALADDVADIALDAAREAWPSENKDGHHYVMRVVSDPALIRDVDVFRVVEGRLKNLRARVDELVPAPHRQKVPKAEETAAVAEAIPAVVAVGVAAQAAGLASKLLAKSYHVSGEEVAVDDLGFDLLVARYLRLKKQSDEQVEIEVDRLMPTAESTIMTQIWQLALDAEQDVVPEVARRAITLAEATAHATAAEAEIEALDLELQELDKRVPEKAAAGGEGQARGGEPRDVLSLRAERNKRRDDLAAKLPTLQSAVSEARGQHDQATGLRDDIDDFVTYALSPTDATGRPPAVQAARIERLVSGHSDGGVTYVLYCRPIAGGIDRTLETKLGPDRWIALAGATVEFALLGTDGKLLTSGVRSVLQSSSMNLGHPESLAQARPNYGGLDRGESN
jgi:hypothetical protein